MVLRRSFILRERVTTPKICRGSDLVFGRSLGCGALVENFPPRVPSQIGVQGTFIPDDGVSKIGMRP